MDGPVAGAPRTGPTRTGRVDEGHPGGAGSFTMTVEQEASRVADHLGAEGVELVMLTMVDNAGITRARAVPLRRFPAAATAGVGLSSAWHAVAATDAVTTSEHVPNPAGDMRLVADARGARRMGSEPGWAWAPVDQRTKAGAPHPCCPRDFLRRMTSRCRAAGLELRIGTEVEWFLASAPFPEGRPAHDGPAVGASVLVHLSDHIRSLVSALEDQGLPVEAINAEYSNGQLELALPPAPPVEAADAAVLTRLTIHSVSQRGGWRASFSPAFSGPMGNGGHLHLSVWRGEHNLLSGGEAAAGMHGEGEAFLAGILGHLPELTAIGAPSPASYIRLQPSRWAGAYRCWGIENREAAMRFVMAETEAQRDAANVEVKCFDEAANPYLVLGAIAAAGLDGVERRLRLPPPYQGDPGLEAAGALARLGVDLLPRSLDEAMAKMRTSQLLVECMGPALHGSFLDVRECEAEAFRHAEEAAIVDAYRWRF